MSSEEKLITEFHGVKLNKQRGVLVLTSLRVAWAPGDITETFHANHLYEDIKAQRISAESSSKVQLQLVLHSGSQVKFHFTADNALEQRQQVKTYVAERLSQTLRISPELEAKNSLLKSKPTLYQLYKDLVTTSIITAEEFWASHTPSHTSNQDTGKGHQEGGLPSAFLADVQAVHDGCNTTRYNLSPDAIQAIFKTYPAVRRRHLECVPDKMSEEQFWTKFFQSQLLHQQDAAGGTFLEATSEDFKQEQLHTDTAAVLLNTTETASTILDQEGYGNSSSSSPSVRRSTPLSLLHRCNHHSGRVLQVLQGDSLASSSSSSLSSPQLPQQQLLQQLSLPPQHYVTSAARPQGLQSVARSVSTWQLQQEVDPQSAQSAISHFAPGGVLMSGVCGQNATSLLTEKQQQELLRHQAAIAELLRHFWACFPVRTPQLEDKVHRLHQCLVEYSNKQLVELQQVLDNSDSLHVVQHLNSTLEKAGQHYNKWLTKRKTLAR